MTVFGISGAVSVISRHPDRIAIAVALLLVTGCAEMPPGEDEAGDSRVQQLAAAGDWNALAAAAIHCGSGEACAKEHATKGDACLRLVIQQPQSATARQGRTRELLDCAEQSYRKALDKSAATAPGRISYHGGLLLTLSERRNRLDVRAGADQRERENQKLLTAAQDTRREVPSSALGFLYGASAHVYRAALKPDPRHRCNDLRQAEAMLRRSPPPPQELADEMARMRSLVARELRESRCPTIRRQ